MAVDVSPHSLSRLAGKLPCGPFSPHFDQNRFLAAQACSLLICSVGRCSWKTSVDEYGIRYHRCLGPALHKIVSCRKCGLSLPWLSCWGQGSRASLRFGQQPPLGPQQAGVPQPFVGAQLCLWLLRAAARMGARMLECAILPQQLASPGQSCWCGELLGSELWWVSSVSSWHPEERPRAGHGLASLQGGLSVGTCLGQAEQQPLPGLQLITAAPSARGVKGLPQWAATTAPKGEHSVWEQDGLSWGGRPVTVVLGELYWGCWFGKHGGAREQEETAMRWSVRSWGKLTEGIPGAKSWVNWSRPQVPARGTPSEERTWFLWVDGVQETCRNASSSEMSLAEAQSAGWRVESPCRACRDRETLGQFNPFGEYLKCYIYAICKRSCESFSELQQWAELYTILDNLF